MDTPGDNVENDFEHDGNNGEIIDPPGEGDNDATGPAKEAHEESSSDSESSESSSSDSSGSNRARIALGRRCLGEMHARRPLVFLYETPGGIL